MKKGLQKCVSLCINLDGMTHTEKVKETFLLRVKTEPLVMVSPCYVKT